MLEKILNNIFAILVEAYPKCPIPVGTIVKITDIRNFKEVGVVVYSFDNTIVKDSSTQDSISKLVGTNQKILTGALKPYYSIAVTSGNLLERYTTPIEHFLTVPGKVTMNKKKGKYYISPNILELLNIDLELKEMTRLKVIYINRALYIVETYLEDNSSFSFSVAESGAVEICEENSAVLEQIFTETFGTKEVSELVISKLPNVVKLDRLSYSLGFRINLVNAKEETGVKVSKGYINNVLNEFIANREQEPQPIDNIEELLRQEVFSNTQEEVVIVTREERVNRGRATFMDMAQEGSISTIG